MTAPNPASDAEPTTKAQASLPNELSFEGYLRVLLFVCLGLSAYFSLAFIAQPILEAHDFRQTQTALTSYYFIKNGFSLAYWTPVIGQGWSIPFEFPFYQEIVARASVIFGAPLTNTGRVISYIFSLLSCIPIYATLRLLKFDLPTRLFCLILFISSPLYLFWGSTFMIETTANFLTLCFCYYAVKMLVQPSGIKDGLLTSLFLGLALLQKVTTALPPAMVFVLAGSVTAMRTQGLKGSLPAIGRMLLVTIPPVIVVGAWTHFADQIKLHNPVAVQLTSSAQTGWNFGTLEQRLSAELWSTVIWSRIFAQNLLGPVGLAAIFGAFLIPSLRTRVFVLACALAGLLPLFIFTNVHIIHDYYQSANLVFFIIAVGVSVFALCDRFIGNTPGVRGFIVSAFLVSNLFFFHADFMQLRMEKLSADNRLVLRLAEFIKANSDPDDTVMWYGFGWSSAPGFYAERKSLTVPPWGDLETDTVLHTAKYLQTAPTIIVQCQNAHSQQILAAIVAAYKVQYGVQIDHCMAFLVGRHRLNGLDAKVPTGQ